MNTASTPRLEAARAKQAVRERVWALLEDKRAARFSGAKGRIPNFAGAPAAAVRWPRSQRGGRPAWSRPTLTPRSSQFGRVAWPTASSCTWPSPAWPTSVRSSCFTRSVLASPHRAASITGSTRAGRRVGVAELQPVDLVVCGSVAVNRQGARIGKGGGFSDPEFALLVEAGLIGTGTVVATTVHPLQVLTEALPETAHDFRLDLIVTSEEVITCRRSRRPPGILWEHLDDAKTAAIPALAARTRRRAQIKP